MVVVFLRRHGYTQTNCSRESTYELFSNNYINQNSYSLAINKIDTVTVVDWEIKKALDTSVLQS